MPRLDAGSLNAQTILTAVSVFALVVNVALVLVSHRQASIAGRLLDAARRDRELAYFPYLVAAQGTSLPQSSGPPLRVYTLQNVGRGPALKVQLLSYDPYLKAWYVTRLLNLPQDRSQDAEASLAQPALIDKLRGRELRDLGSWTEWEKNHAEITVLICMDQYGEIHRFPSTHAAPQIWVSRKPQRWKAWSE